MIWQGGFGGPPTDTNPWGEIYDPAAPPIAEYFCPKEYDAPIGVSIFSMYCTTTFSNTTMNDFIYYLYDHLGNTRITYSATKNGSTMTIHPESAFDYDPYGVVLRQYTTGPEPYLTTQHQRDTETGLDYRGARFYDAEVGRFLSVDPLAVKRWSMSPYNYVQGNPVYRVDPTGALDWVPEVLNSSYEENGQTIQSGFLAARMEEGDSEQSLADFLDISLERATELFKQRNENGYVAIPNDLVPEINQAIHESKNPTGNDYVDDPLLLESIESNYNCYESVLAIGWGEFIDYSNTIEGNDFVTAITKSAENIDQASLQFGRSFGRWVIEDFGSPDGLDTHAATYLGTSKNGTNYYWSKNGRVLGPSVETENSLNSSWGAMRGLRSDDTPFYNIIR